MKGEEYKPLPVFERRRLKSKTGSSSASDAETSESTSRSGTSTPTPNQNASATSTSSINQPINSTEKVQISNDIFNVLIKLIAGINPSHH